jgi:hypothetical protein
MYAIELFDQLLRRNLESDHEQFDHRRDAGLGGLVFDPFHQENHCVEARDHAWSIRVSSWQGMFMVAGMRRECDGNNLGLHFSSIAIFNMVFLQGIDDQKSICWNSVRRTLFKNQPSNSYCTCFIDSTAIDLCGKNKIKNRYMRPSMAWSVNANCLRTLKASKTHSRMRRLEIDCSLRLRVLRT